MRPVKDLASLALLALLSVHVAGQGLVADATPAPDVAPARLDAADHAVRMQRIRLTGDLGLPMLPPVLPDSPRDSLLFADRFPVNQGPSSEGPDGGTPTMFQGFIPMGHGGTGTDKNEIFEYQLGNDYDEFGAPHPLVVAYHGYGASHSSVAAQSTIDEECNTRGWVYMAPTGIDDQLFGSPVSQQNTQAAIQWMLDNWNIDPDRIYMVGFSVGAGIVSNFTARRRDPDGMMIAAVGIVSGTYDWTMSYVNGSAPLQALLENFYNFGGSPTTYPFRYKRSSDLYFRAGTYPPLPGTVEPEDSMATNLGSTPVYHTWDTGDWLPEAEAQNPVMGTILSGLGGTYMQVTTSGTVDPNTLLPAPHSWAVLDEVDLFDFFDGKTVDRTPNSFDAQLDGGNPVSYLETTQVTIDAFTYVDGLSDTGVDALGILNVKNAGEVVVDLGEAEQTTTGPINLLAASDDANGFSLCLTNFTGNPAYLLDSVSSALIPGTLSDPLAGSLRHHVPGNTLLNADIISEPNWTTKLYTAPDPVAPGGAMVLTIDADPPAVATLLLIGFSEALNNVPGGNKVTVSLGPTTLLVQLPLNGSGDLSLPGGIPNNPSYSGLEVKLQSIDINGSGQVVSISNMWTVHIQ
jgi:acetyl esterase/lipase